MKKIGIVAHVGVGNTTLSERVMATAKQHDVIVIETEKVKPMNIVEINGVQYERIEREEKTGNRKALNMMALSLAMMGNMDGYGYGGGNKRQRPVVNIEEEYALIQQKKSDLSKSDRDWVEKIFHENYKIVTP